MYVHSSTFNTSVYVPYYATWFVHHNEFAGKDGHRESASTAVQVLGEVTKRFDGEYDG